MSGARPSVGSAATAERKARSVSSCVGERVRARARARVRARARMRFGFAGDHVIVKVGKSNAEGDPRRGVDWA